MLVFHVVLYCICWISYTNAEFANTQNSTVYRVYWAHGVEGCSDGEKYRSFPELYRTNSGVAEDNPEIGAPENFSVTYFEGSLYPNDFYPGMNVTFHPPEKGYDKLKGYDLEITWKNEIYCFIFILNQMIGDQERTSNEMKEQFFPLHDLTSFWLTVTSLPVFSSNQTVGPEQLVTSKKYYRDPYGALMEPADWAAKIAHYVVKSNDSRSLQIVFSRPPAEYGFQRFQLALIPIEDYIHVQSAITTEFYYEFQSVERGHYKISINAVDDFFSQLGRCLCHKDNMCTNCLSSQTAKFTVE